MKLYKRTPTGREKDEASIKLLEKLRMGLYSDNVSKARRSAFNLSWLQEDGFEILEEALFSESPKRAKTAAAYGLRSMHGRMKKKAVELLKNGLKHKSSDIRYACKNSISLMNSKGKKKTPKRQMQRSSRRSRIEIREISHESPRRQRRVGPGRGNHLTGRMGRSRR